MKRTTISSDWLFRLSDSDAYTRVNLPHDYVITMPRDENAAGGKGNGFFPTGTGIYVKYLIPDSDSRHFILDVDGAYMCTTVTFNEETVTVHPNGYTPFLVDLSEYILKGQSNKLVIETAAQQPSTRWYSGAGLYRDVFLWTGGAIRIEPRDAFITTKSASDDEALIGAAYEISADGSAAVILRARVIDENGACVAEGATELDAAAGKKTSAQIEIRIENPRLWDTEHPNLYTLHTEILLNGTAVDEDERTFGIRTVSADARRGLLLNGKPIKLRGGCIHHDNGVLGAADYPAAVRRKVSLLKKAGFNALRSAHNPPSLNLLKVCDELGMLLMDEAFDAWDRPKNALDCHLWFADRCARDIAEMVLRDRNHPCVISYSVGNEIAELHSGTKNSTRRTEMLASEIRKYDATRLVTAAFFGKSVAPEDIDPDDYKSYFEKKYMGTDEDADDGGRGWSERTQGAAEALDIVGYNYLYTRYERDHEKFPERVIWGSETKALYFYDSWHAAARNSYVLGDFTWTAYDNIGEVGAGRFLWERDGVLNGFSFADYPWRTCFQGDLDLCGNRRPQSYFREAVWIGNTEPRIFTTHPMHNGETFSGTTWHWYDVHDSWTFGDEYLGAPVKCEVYTDADEIEWSLNGKVLGRSRPQKAIAYFTVPYEKGTVTATAYKNGEKCGSSALMTVGAPATITVEAEAESLIADGRDLCYLDIAVADSDGNRVPYAEKEIVCTVRGGELLGVFSGDPASRDRFGSNVCHTFDGRALAVIRAHSPGALTVTAECDGLDVGCATVKAIPAK